MPGPPSEGQGDTRAIYSPELYDDCRDAFGSISPAGLRQLWAESGDVAELGALSDDDVRGILKIACLMFATGEGADYFGGLLSQEE